MPELTPTFDLYDPRIEVIAPPGHPIRVPLSESETK